MLKKLAVTTTVVTVLTLIALSYVSARFIDQKEILRVTAEMETVRAGRAALEETVRGLNEQQAELNRTIDDQKSEIRQGQEKIAQLEQANAAARLTVRRLRRSSEQLESFSGAFPEVAAARNYGVTDIFDDVEQVNIKYLCLPLTFSETFVIEHNTMNTYKAQIDEFKRNEALYDSVVSLKDQVLALETQKSMAFREEYEKVFTKYEDINGKYIGLLQQPRFKFGGLGMSIGMGILGVAIGAGL